MVRNANLHMGHPNSETICQVIIHIKHGPASPSSTTATASMDKGATSSINPPTEHRLSWTKIKNGNKFTATLERIKICSENTIKVVYWLLWFLHKERFNDILLTLFISIIINDHTLASSTISTYQTKLLPYWMLCRSEYLIVWKSIAIINKNKMSIYSGFATRQQEQSYDNLILDLISVLQRRIIKFYVGEEAD